MVVDCGWWMMLDDGEGKLRTTTAQVVVGVW